MASGLTCHSGGNEDQSPNWVMLPDYYHLSPALSTRRSLRLMKISDLCSSKAGNVLHQKEKGQKNTRLSPKSPKAKRLGLRKQNQSAIETIGCDDVITTVTLRDLQSRCKIRKRKADEIKSEKYIDPLAASNPNILQEDEPKLDETISYLKLKLAKLSSNSAMRKRCIEPPLHSTEKMMHKISPSFGSSQRVLHEASLKETDADEFFVDSKVNLKLNIENYNKKMETFADQTSSSPLTSDSTLNTKEIAETFFLNGSDAEICFINSSPNIISKHDPNAICLAEFRENVSEGESEGSQLDGSISNVMDPSTSNLINVANIQNDVLRTDSEHFRKLSSDVLEKDDQSKMQSLESHNCNKELHLIAAGHSTQHIESNFDNYTCPFGVDDCSDVNRKISSLNMTNINIAPLVSEFIASFSCANVDTTPSSTIEDDDDQQAPLSDDNCTDQCYPNCLATANHLLDAATLPDGLVPSSTAHLVNKCSISHPHFYEISNETDLVEASASPANEFLETVVDFPTDSFSETPTDVDVERERTMTTRVPSKGTKCDAENSPKKLLSNRMDLSPKSQEKLLQALNDGILDEILHLSNSMEKRLLDKEAMKKPLSSGQDDGEASLVTVQNIKKQKFMHQTLPHIATITTKGILKLPDKVCGNSCSLKYSSMHTPMHDAIMFSKRQLQDTKSIAAKLLQGLNNLKCIAEETLFSAETSYFPPTFNAEEIRLATKEASKLEETTKKWLFIMEKDCTRFCKLMRLAEDKLASPVTTLHKERKKITFADEVGGMLCQIKVYEQEPVAFIVPKT